MDRSRKIAKAATATLPIVFITDVDPVNAGIVCGTGKSAGFMPSPDHTIELQDLCLQRPQLGTESGNTRTGNLGQPLIICIGSNPEQLLDTLVSDRRDDPKLCKMSADGVDHRGLLADEQVPGTVQRQAALLLWRLGRATNRMFGLVTASQIASASVASFLCRFTYGFT